MALECFLSGEPFDAAEALARFATRAEGDGAITSFTGLARPSTREGAPVAILTLDHHPRLTLASMEEIGRATLARFDISHLHIIHRYGPVMPGEAIVFVAASALHRRAAFEAADYAMDRLKTDAVFWKREESSGGSAWIEPTDGDYSDRSRWNTEKCS